MLKEIYCEEFKDHGNIREPIEFHRGLNVVIGKKKSGKENSIGKTSALLVVDYCFGGTSYRKSKAAKALGVHQIFFTFSFERDYFFCRTTKTDDDLYKCDANRVCQESMSLEGFKRWLADKYSLTNASADIREIISPYFRIYNKSNLDAKNFLASYVGQSQGSQIRNFQKLFDGYSAIKTLAEKVDAAEVKKNVLSNAKKKKVDLIELQDVGSLNGLKKQLAELEKREQNLLNDKSDNIVRLDKENSDKLLNVKLELRRMRSRKTILEMRMRNSHEISMGEMNVCSETYEALLEFFPDVNIRLLKDISDFHSRFTLSLKKDFEECDNRTKEELEKLSNLIEEKVMELSKFEDFGDVTTAFLKTYSSLQMEKMDCLKKIELIEKQKMNSQEVGAQKKELRPLEMKLLQKIKVSINTMLNGLSANVFENENSQVKIDFPTLTSAMLETDYDDGTSTDFSGLQMFDLALLEKTCLPAIVHDSYWFSNIKGNRLDRILTLHNTNTPKQIFISIDEVEKCSKEVQDMLYEHKVLLLETNGGELYGRCISCMKDKES